MGLALSLHGDDVELYARYGQQLRVGLMPYAEVAIEYPPGALPLFVLPALGARISSYEVGWCGLMLFADLVGFISVLRLGRRAGSMAGAWWWVALPTALGPVVYRRLDLMPAVASVWAWERASAGRLAAAGAALGVGALIKLWPAVLAILLFVGLPRRWWLAVGALGVTIAALLPLASAGTLPDLAEQVVGYHAARGLQVESTWANALLLAALAGHPVEVTTSFGAAHVSAAAASEMKAAASAGSLIVLAVSVISASRGDSGDLLRLANLACALIAALLVVGNVLSPQYLLWLIALVAIAESDPARRMRGAAWLLLGAALLTNALVSGLYLPLVNLQSVGVIAVTARNVVLLTAAAAAAAGARAARRPSPAPHALGDRRHPRPRPRRPATRPVRRTGTRVWLRLLATGAPTAHPRSNAAASPPTPCTGGSPASTSAWAPKSR